MIWLLHKDNVFLNLPKVVYYFLSKTAMNKKVLISILISGAVCLAPSCNKNEDVKPESPELEQPGTEDPGTDEPETPENPSVAKELFVYACGADGKQGVYWCNGEAVVLKSPLSESSKWTRGKAMTVVGDDVYVAGYEGKTVVVWKNGEPEALTDGTEDAKANGIAVVGSDIYVVGAYNGSGVYWKNGEQTELARTGEVRSIVIDGDDVYMAGNDGGVATFWKNGEAVALSDDYWSESDVYELCLIDGNVFAVGYHDTEAVTWAVAGTDATETALTDDMNWAQCRGVAVDASGKIYVAGNDGTDPVVWVDGGTTKLAKCNSFGTASDIACVGGKVFVGGISDNDAVVWVDGEAMVLASATSGPSVYGICVVEKEVPATTE